MCWTELLLPIELDGLQLGASSPDVQCERFLSLGEGLTLRIMSESFYLKCLLISWVYSVSLFSVEVRL